MTDETFKKPSPPLPSSSPANIPAPVGHGFRRAFTIDETSQLRRRPPFGQINSAATDTFRRRSSGISDYSLNEARRNLQTSTEDLLNPAGSSDNASWHSNWETAPLAAALLPAIAGILFKNGSAVVTDIMLLLLAFVFLKWAVTQPWNWYHAAQAVRVREETVAESAVEDESENEQLADSVTSANLENVPEEGDVHTDSIPKPRQKPHVPVQTKASRQALAELRLHEAAALLSCFLFPALGAYLLHKIRGQLTRPAEGLVSDYNLTIFLLAAEIKPVSHVIKLITARTLHLQRIVNANPYQEESAVSSSQVAELYQRIDELEGRLANGQNPRSADENGHTEQSFLSKKQADHLVREARNAIQPELDALNRAVRRYEKKATVLALQTDARLGDIDMRLNDAIALAAAAAKNSNAQWGLMSWIIDKAVNTLLFPFYAITWLVTFPIRTMSTILGISGGKESDGAKGKRGKGMKYTTQRNNGRPSNRPSSWR